VAHPTAQTYLVAELQYAATLIGQHRFNTTNDANAPSRFLMSPCMTNAFRRKLRKYDQLMTLAAAQVRMGKRNSSPKLLIAVATSNGSLSEPFRELLEFVHTAYMDRMREHVEVVDDAVSDVMDEGLTPEHLTARFRSRLNIAVALACASGTALVQQSAAGTARVRHAA